MKQPPVRIAFYSHDTMGLGHTRRNLLIAEALARSALHPTTFMISGASAVHAYRIPRHGDVLTLPQLRKRPDGGYESASLDVSLEQLIALRARTIRAAIEAYRPDVLVVDKVPRGVSRELDPTLELLRARGARCVLGLRDILDDPATVEREWSRDDTEAAIREFYQAIWIYGDPRIYPTIQAYGFADDIAARARYVGYLDPRRRLNGERSAAIDPREPELPKDRFALCYVGGGQDGVRLAKAFAKADLPDDLHGVILTGPFMPRLARERLAVIARRRPRLHVIEFLARPGALLRRAERIIAMGGYNTMCEILALGKPTLVVPRVLPRSEQLIRARRFAALGLLDCLHPRWLNPQALTDWLAAPAKSKPARAGIDLGGLARLPVLLSELLDEVPAPSSRPAMPLPLPARDSSAAWPYAASVALAPGYHEDSLPLP